MSLKSAFAAILGLKKRSVTYSRPSVPISVTITVHPADYSRSFEGPSDMAIDGREWVIQKDVLTAASFPLPPKRGDKISDPDVGTFSIDEVDPMYDLGGGIIGYRVRTQ